MTTRSPTGSTGSFATQGGGPDWKRFARRWGFFLFILVVAYWFREVLLPFVLAITVAYILAPPVNRLAQLRIGRRYLPRGAAVLICYVAVIASVSLFIIGFLPRLSGDFARLGREAPKLWDKINKDYTPRLAHYLEKKFPSLKQQNPKPTPTPGEEEGEPPPPPGTVMTVTPLANGDYAVGLAESGVEIERVDDKHMVMRPRQEHPRPKLEDVIRGRMLKALVGLQDQAGDILRYGQQLVAGVIAAIMKLVLVLMVAGFILVDIDRIHRFIRGGLIPDRYRGEYDHIVDGIDRGLSGVIRGQLVICLLNAILTLVGLLIFDVKYAILLAAIAGVMSLIPIFGSILSSVPIVAIAMVSAPDGVDFFRGVFVLLWIIGIHFLEANFLSPKIIGSAARMHPVVVVFALIAGEHTYGLVGALLAVPIASIIQTLFMYFRTRAWAGGSTSPQSGPVPAPIAQPQAPPNP
jgi:predicted PurR-regulated permease PerM